MLAPMPTFERPEPRTRRHRATLGLLLALGACAAAPTPTLPTAPPRVLIFGEQHDQPDQQRQVAATVSRLAASSRLAAVVLEMAERGHGTAGLPRDADDVAVRAALDWNGWPWENYRPVVMAAVHAGVPVFGGNLPRSRQRSAMADASLDGSLGAAARAEIAEAVRVGHCGLLPAAQEPGMVRIQIARDQSMADTIEAALARATPGQQVLLLTGAQHASRDRGVPLHLAARDPALAGSDLRVVMFGAENDLRADERRPSRHTTRPDACAELAERLAGPTAAPAPAAAASMPGR